MRTVWEKARRVNRPKSPVDTTSILKANLILTQGKVLDQKEQLARLRASMATSIYGMSEEAAQ